MLQHRAQAYDVISLDVDCPEPGSIRDGEAHLYFQNQQGQWQYGQTKFRCDAGATQVRLDVFHDA